jgi:hypothetical protein
MPPFQDFRRFQGGPGMQRPQAGAVPFAGGGPANAGTAVRPQALPFAGAGPARPGVSVSGANPSAAAPGIPQGVAQGGVPYANAAGPSRAGASPLLGQFKKGGKVKKTGNYKLHKGERVLTAKQAKVAPVALLLRAKKA